ncbi:MAG: substrate-binding domain-containing protein, partial [Nitrospinae bacterium]|nr:substrate-binding domain-containing protein [Nitrospinota bacterium]
AIRTAVDALAVFVNKDNPLKCLSMAQVDAIFSKSRRYGYKETVKTWGQLGLTGDWANRPVSLYGRNSASGTYGFFKEHALKNGDFKDEVKEQPGSASVVQGVTVDRYAIGYSGIGYTTPGVRAVPLAEKAGATCVEATAENAYAGMFPLARFLYVYINKAPGKALEPLTREFMKLVLAKEGQEVVIKDGFFPIPADPDGRPIRSLAYVSTPNGSITSAAVGPMDLALVTRKERKALIGPSTGEEAHQTLSLPVGGEISSLAGDSRGEELFVGTSSGQVVRIDIREPSAPRLAGAVLATTRPGVSVSSMGFLIGDRTLVVGDAAGGVSSWQLLQDDGGESRLTRIHDFARYEGAVVAFAPSRRDKGFITADTAGTVGIHHGTTGKTLLTLRVGGDRIRAVTFAPKADGLITVDTAGRLLHWAVANPHPEITWQSLFGKIWYEGYKKPEYVWQSTGGSDDFEPKLSLTPLIYGTLKGTFYALLFAGPVALLAALYTSQFLHPTLKGVVKPTVEIMAALPSYAQEQIRLQERKLELQGVTAGPQVQRFRGQMAGLQTKYTEQAAALAKLRESLRPASWSRLLMSRRKTSLSPRSCGSTVLTAWGWLRRQPSTSPRSGNSLPATRGSLTRKEESFRRSSGP